MVGTLTHRILVTGASGFVGTALLQLLEREHAGCKVFAFGHGEGQRNPIDLRDRDAVDGAVREIQPTALVHLAAVAAPSDARNAPRHAWDVNVTGTMNLAESVMRHAPEARIVYVGSSEAYGASFQNPAGPLTENAPLRPVNIYGSTKAAADIMIGQLSYEGLRAIRFRPFNHTGPGQSDTYVVSDFARQVAEILSGKREPVIHVGNLEAERDFLDVRDVVRAYAAAAIRVSETGPDCVYNIASGRPRRIRDILDALIVQSGIDIEVREDPAKLRPNEIPIAYGDASKARAELNWTPLVPFEQTLADVLGYWRRACSPR
ncbi:MAG: NAD-dependent epimerase/dehydratase family protein [Mesorhizobium sp.]|nr:NAD-dependent epimerase/dehydratase family protein [Mesorhizobium sp. M1A.F.Ca.IN.020.04.1.1]RUW13197.1 NAD-dependent epimerase/dehydratase family protein [Mesorhizobium sp. M1A.F.Ca.IN.020.03.1.1]RWF75136.1 MAG: NAD-dependent epimerase/dehydratase family protein [Mesorhizobium sp.]RWG15000.1 MAG: NAD-dependent epimerase/dehydratase family protein [Mesorhizobium sp.]RWG32047.1 MAG: NAD-dependent epimerase/dehydratase family protein [Mesorhizobium sp.]